MHGGAAPTPAERHEETPAWVLRAACLGVLKLREVRLSPARQSLRWAALLAVLMAWAMTPAAALADDSTAASAALRLKHLPAAGAATPDSVFAAVSGMARDLAAAPFSDTDPPLAGAFADLDYDGYRRLRPRQENALRLGGQDNLAVLPLPRGGTHRDLVNLWSVEDGRIRALDDSPGFVDFQDFAESSAADRASLGFSGWRALFRFSDARPQDEAIVFQDGVYFRAIGAPHAYGLSARALAIGVGAPGGEEFPEFTDMWIFAPDNGGASLTAVALMDSPSVAGAYRFTITPGDATVVDVEASLHPRRDLADIGIGAMSSMFLHGPADRAGVDDFRPEVHDSDGLLMHTGRGEWIWRPLVNPEGLQESAFTDENPRGFGLMQRARDFNAYVDLEARYEDRPGAWIETRGDWGAGAVHLFEIPTTTEYNDNIAVFWRPAAPLKAGVEHTLAYRINWTSGEPAKPLARVSATRVGAAAHNARARRFIVDFVGDAAFATASLEARVTATAGEIRNIHVIDAPEFGGRRLAFELEPYDARVVELRAELHGDAAQSSETWLYRWTPES